MVIGSKPRFLVASLVFTLGCTKFLTPVDSGVDSVAVQTGGGGSGGSSAADGPASNGGGGGGGAGGTAGVAGTAGAGGTAGGNDGGDGPTLSSTGVACTMDVQCTSGHCVDGYCCDGTCTGQCESCKEPNALGRCTIVSSGAPRGSRAACGGTAPCQGTCDGSDGNACAFPGNTVQCTAASCSNGMATTASVCNGAGACTSASITACATNQCADTTKCSGGCSAALPCAAGRYCDVTGVCLPLKANGVSCQTGTQCITGNCVDGVCCDSGCAGQCQSCNEPSKAGTCVTVTGAPRGSRTPCAGTQATCVGHCDGTSATQCAYPGSTATCVAASCSGDFTMVTASVCSGAGSCTSQSLQGCASGTYCSAGACVPQKSTGAGCQSNAQCASGNCTNAVCCPGGQTACGGACVDLTNSNLNCGTCGTVCPSGTQTCITSHCLLVDGQPCTTNAACASGICSPFFVDADGDGYGTSVTASFCGVTPPAGYAARSGDCCDSSASLAVSKLIHPGADFQGSTAGGLCGITWDFDCSGAVEKSQQACNTCTGSCTCALTDYPEADCGTMVEANACEATPICGVVGVMPVKLLCR